MEIIYYYDSILISKYDRSILTDDDAPEDLARRADKSAIVTILYGLRKVNYYQYLFVVQCTEKLRSLFYLDTNTLLQKNFLGTDCKYD